MGILLVQYGLQRVGRSTLIEKSRASSCGRRTVSIRLEIDNSVRWNHIAGKGVNDCQLFGIKNNRGLS
jgi:hypothetical protein